MPQAQNVVEGAQYKLVAELERLIPWEETITLPDGSKAKKPRIGMALVLRGSSPFVNCGPGVDASQLIKGAIVEVRGKLEPRKFDTKKRGNQDGLSFGEAYSVKALVVPEPVNVRQAGDMGDPAELEEEGELEEPIAPHNATQR